MRKEVGINDRSVESAGVPKDYRQSICELVLNGFDAKAAIVDISFDADEVNHIDSIVVPMRKRLLWTLIGVALSFFVSGQTLHDVLARSDINRSPFSMCFASPNSAYSELLVGTWFAEDQIGKSIFKIKLVEGHLYPAEFIRTADGRWPPSELPALNVTVFNEYDFFIEIGDPRTQKWVLFRYNFVDFNKLRLYPLNKDYVNLRVEIGNSNEYMDFVKKNLRDTMMYHAPITFFRLRDESEANLSSISSSDLMGAALLLLIGGAIVDDVFNHCTCSNCGGLGKRSGEGCRYCDGSGKTRCN